MDKSDLLDRTRQFGLEILRLADTVPKTASGRVLTAQLIRAATSVGANYRAACRGRSKAEFIAKLGIVVEEADECCYWLELMKDGALLPQERINPLLKEADELTAIFTSSVRTAKARSKL